MNDRAAADGGAVPADRAAGGELLVDVGAVERRWYRGFGTLALGQGATMALRFVALGLIAHALRPGAFGVASVAAVVGTYLVAVAFYGFEVLGTRDAARTEQDDRSLLQTMTGVRLAIALVLVACVVALAYGSLALGVSLAADRRDTLVLACLVVIPLAFDTRWWFIGRHETVPVAWSDALSAIGYVTGAALLVNSPHDVRTAVAVLVLAETLRVAILGAMSIRRIGWWAPRFRFDRALANLRSSLPITAFGVVRTAVVSLDVVIVSVVLARTPAGQYAAASRLYVVGLLLFGLWYQPFLPSLVHTGDRDADAARRLVRAAARRAATILVPLALLASIAAPWAFRLALGRDYAQAGLLFRIYALGLGFIAFTGLLNQVIIARNLQRRLPLVAAAALAIDLIGLAVLLPAIGVWGAPVAAVAAEGGSCAGMYLLLRAGAKRAAAVSAAA